MARRVIVGRLTINMRDCIPSYRFELLYRQNGIVVIIFLFLIALASTAYLMHAYSPVQFRNNQNETTLQALAAAKQALISYDKQDITSSVCNLVCPRPGDLPCPDFNNNGEAEDSCSGSENFRLGRLPWKTLGSNDLRDGAGERLWYAVSKQYKNYPRETAPLNANTKGLISLRTSSGELVNDATTGNGVVAVVIAVHEPLTRYELNGSKTLQARTISNTNNPTHYLDVVQNLDVAKNEDNANFIEFTKNGFISGVIKVMQNNQPVIISNDIVLPIYQSEIAGLSKTVVLNEVAKALKADVNTLPAPTKIDEPSCNGYAKIEEGFCAADTTSDGGFIPVSKGNDVSFSGWQTKNVNSILRGESMHNWFQQNGWRSLVKYQKNSPCLVSEKWCRNINSQMTIRID